MASTQAHDTRFVSARTWAERWDCSLASVRRAAKRFVVRRVYVGKGRNGLVRYDLSDIEKIEEECGLSLRSEVSAGSLVPDTSH